MVGVLGCATSFSCQTQLQFRSSCIVLSISWSFDNGIANRQRQVVGRLACNVCVQVYRHARLARRCAGKYADIQVYMRRDQGNKINR